MYEGNFVICDQEKQYSRNLLQMFARNREEKIQLYLFHTVEELEKFLDQKTIQILLIDQKYPLKLREKIPAEKKFVLVKNMHELLADNEKRIYRYQSAEEIWLQIQNGESRTEIKRKPAIQNPKEGGKEEKQHSLEECKKGQRIQKPEKTERMQRMQKPEKIKKVQSLQKGEVDLKKEIKGSLIGVYSPIHRIGKTKFAMELGKEFAKKEPVLYLNLEEYAGNDFYFHDRTGQTLADLLYYARQEKGNLGLRISMMAGQDEDLDYILPMPYVQDLQEVFAEEWLKLFNRILENCIYGKIILDLGDSVRGLFQILEACDTVYTPFIEDGTARAKLNQYAENLRITGREKVLKKTIQKKMKPLTGQDA